MQTFVDKRLDLQGDISLFNRLELLGTKAIQVYNKPDSGPRGIPNKLEVHTYSSVKCWAACEGLAKIAKKLKQTERYEYWREWSQRMHTEIIAKSWNDTLKSFVTVWGGQTLDPHLLLLPKFGFIDAKDERFVSTVAAIEKTLLKNNFITATPDDVVGLNSATFWYIEVLASQDRKEEARALFCNMLSTVNKQGILSETVHCETKELWGNFPQNSAMVGLIKCAVRLSVPWHLNNTKE